jgi:hypothetical protein
MIEGFQVIAEMYLAQGPRLMACMEGFGGFAERVGPFFDIINIFTQIRPEYTSLLCSAIRLIFAVSSPFAVLKGI